MNLTDYFADLRQAISQSILGTLADNSGEFALVSRDSPWIFSLLGEYATSGKMLRGILACLGYELFSEAKGSSGHDKDSIALATALELFQAGLLVHDDIMDKDDMRRGKPTLHKVFEQKEALRESATAGLPATCGGMDFGSLGEAMGICAGDIYYFIAWKLIARLGPRMGEGFSEELVKVCLAQMKDVQMGTSRSFPPLKEVLDVYAYKTARYTITLPLSSGARLAGRSDAIPALEELGLNLGILFQLQDDYLGLFGDEEELGKPVGSDIREGKKTPYMVLLAESLPEAEKRHFLRIFGNPGLTVDNVLFVRSLVKAYGIDAKVRRLAENYAKASEALLASFSHDSSGIHREKLDLLKQFIDYSLSRTF